MKKFNLKQQIKNYFDYNVVYAYVTLIFIELLIVFWSYYTWSYHRDIGHWLSIDNNAVNFVLMQIGLFLGVFIGIILLKKLLINRRLKVRSIVISLAIIIPLIGFILSFVGASFNMFFGRYLRNISFPQIHIETGSEVYFLLTGVLLGAMLGAGLYIWITKSHNVTFIYGGIFLFLGFSKKYRYNDSFEVDPATQAIAIGCIIIGLLIFLWLLLRKYSVKRKEFKQVFRIRYILIAVIAFVVALIITNSILEDLRHKHELIERVKEEQRRLRELEQSGGCPGGCGSRSGGSGSGSSGLDFGDRAVTIQKSVVGFYKAKSPLYLKISSFDMYRSEYGLSIDKSYNSCTKESGYYYYGYGYDENPDYGVASEQDKDTVKIIYAKSASSGIPSTRNIVDFDESKYCLSDYDETLVENFSNNQTSSVVKTEYEYDWRKEQVLNESELRYPDYFYENHYYFNDHYVSENSDRYDEIFTLAKSVTAGATTDLEKAKRIEQYFHENYYYSFRPGIDDQDNPLDDFILDSKHGYCAHFASSMVLMLEMLDVKASLIGGFYSSDYSNDLESYVMMSTDLHMWVEVLDSEKGWVRFDPTSSRCDTSRDECGSLFGGGAGGRNYGSDFDVDIEYILETVDPQVNFDDLFGMTDNSRLGLEEGIGFNPETIREFSEEYQERLKEIEKLEQERKEREKQEEKRKEEQEKNWRLVGLIVLVVFILLLHLIVLIIVLFILYKYWKRIDMRQFLKKQRDRRWVRKIDQKIRTEYWKQLQHIAASKEEYFDMSSKDFLKEVENQNSVSGELLEVYRLINRVLYSKNYTSKDIQSIRKGIDLL